MRRATHEGHCLIRGTTGGGKSFFAASQVLRRLKTQPRCPLMVLDPKSELGQLLAESLPGLHGHLGHEPGAIIRCAPLRGRPVPMDPLVRDERVAVETEARATTDVLCVLFEGEAGNRIRHFLYSLVKIGLRVEQATLLDLLEAVRSERGRACLLALCEDPQDRWFLEEGFLGTPAATREATASRLDMLLALPEARAVLCCGERLSDEDRLEGLFIADLSGGPLGSRDISRFFSALLFGEIAAGIHGRATGREQLVVLADEVQELSRALHPDELVRLLELARFKGVGLWGCCQNLEALARVNPLLPRSWVVNAYWQAVFRPDREDLRGGLDELLDVSGRMRDPDRPDRLLTPEAEKRHLRAVLARLPKRHALLVDRDAGTSIIRTLNLPVDELRRRADALPRELRDAYEAGRRFELRARVPLVHRASEAGPTVAASAPRSRRARPRRGGLALP